MNMEQIVITVFFSILGYASLGLLMVGNFSASAAKYAIDKSTRRYITLLVLWPVMGFFFFSRAEYAKMRAIEYARYLNE